MRLPKLTLALWILLLPGCGNVRRVAAADDSGPPVRGGTLKIVGGGDVDHLASTSMYTNPGQLLLRTFVRQLVSYPIDRSFDAASQIVPDLADPVPTMENGGVSPDGRMYTFRLRRGVLWNTKPPREVNAADAVRGMKLLCNPVNPTGAPGYYETTIVGMQEFCDAFAKVPGTVEGIKQFMARHDLEGVKATDEFTLVFRLMQPASDFLNLIGMPFASPVPVEYLDYLPDGPEFRQHTISNGPYQITKYIANREYQLERNPVWDAKTDPIRLGYVDRISVQMGQDSQLVQLQLEAGTADMSWDFSPPVAELGTLLTIGDPNLILTPPGDLFGQMNYLVPNFLDPNNDGAMKKQKVREALEYAVDKVALGQDWGGPQVGRPLRQAVSSSASGFRAGADQFVRDGDHGDPVKARQLLAEAGYPNGLSLKLAYSLSYSYPQDAQSLQASLKRAGFDVEIVPYTPGDFYSRLLTSPDVARRGVWDLALVGWLPDWFGNNGRSMVETIFDGRHYGPSSVNYGDYNSDKVNGFIDRATIALTREEAEQNWANAAAGVMSDAAIVPLIELKLAWSHSARLRNCAVSPLGLDCDWTGLWLKGAQ